MRPAPEPVAYLVPHTHWDREWYHSADVFRSRLVGVIDELLDSTEPPAFLLDGQAIVLRDYLDWRPEREAELSRALQSGRLEAGPWFVLADNLIPSGEAIVRNLLLGREVLRRLRAEPPPVLYCPDAFGHPAAGPLLAAGFGLPLAIVWRGYGGPQWPTGDAARWRSPSHDEVLLFHLPPDGYGSAANLPVVPEDARLRWTQLLAELQTRSVSGALLLMNGADNHALQSRWGEASASLQGAAAPMPVKTSGIAAFAADHAQRLAGHPLPVITGELRASPRHVWSLQGTFAARADAKRRNAGAERTLVRDVEPWAALARWHAARDLEPLIRAAWTAVITNHPHDTLCGCSVDAVATAMDARLTRIDAWFPELRRMSIDPLTGHDAAEIRDTGSPTDAVILLRNPAPRPRGGVVEVQLDVPLARVPVGPGSADLAEPAREVPVVSVGLTPLPLQRLDRARIHTLDESPRHYPRSRLSERQTVVAWVTELPAYGVTVLPLIEGRSSRRRAPSVVRIVRQRLENEHLACWCDGNGLSVRASDGTTWSGAIGFETVGERGDLYTHSPIPGTDGTGELVRHRITARGPLRAELFMRWRVPVAARRLGTATGEAIAHPGTFMNVDVRARLDAGCRRLRLLLRGTNSAQDHRLRFVVHSGLASPTHWADAAFGSVLRDCAPPQAHSDDVEVIPPTAPLHRSVSLFGADRGLTLISDGLAEYEVTRQGDVAVTLIRATGELSRGDLPERRGHAGWPNATPDAQCLLPFEARFALFPHGLRTDETLARIEEETDDELNPPRGLTAYVASSAENPCGGLRLIGNGLRFEAAKAPVRGDGLIVRCLNLLSRPVEGAWTLNGLGEAWACRLDETRLGALAVAEGRVRFSVPPHALSTILLLRAATT